MEVVNIKKANLNKLGYKNLLHWLENDSNVYIGRNLSFYVPGATKSKWANPYSVKKYGRNQCLELYRKHLYDSGLINNLEELKGKTLGCWCHPEGCHGDILVELLNKPTKLTFKKNG